MLKLSIFNLGINKPFVFDLISNWADRLGVKVPIPTCAVVVTLRLVFVGYPAAYDFMFVYWYLMRFTGESPFSHSALDIKTLAMVGLSKPYRKATKRNMPKRWFDDLPHTHKALDDAIEQGAMFCNIYQEVMGEKES